ncbi:hypothetical protein NHJ13051_002188 [Beauveria bassiana]
MPQSLATSKLLNFLPRAGSSIAIVSLLLEFGANVSAVDDDGETRLHVQALLQGGASASLLTRM